MKPRNALLQMESCNGVSLSLVDHDGRYFLESDGRQIDGSHLGQAARQLTALISRPFRPARQPRIIFLGLGFGHAVKAACECLPQEKSAFVVFPESPALADWISKNLDEDPLDDERIHLDTHSPFAPITNEYGGTQGIFADLDHLEGLAPKRWSITSPTVLANFHERLKTGGLLGLISTRQIPGLDKVLRKAGFDVVTEQAPLSEKSKKNRTLYLARKGHYQRSH